MPATKEILCELKAADAIGHVVIWVLLSIVTLGFCLFLYPYAFTKYVLNKTYIMDGTRKAYRFKCNLTITSQIGHAIMWYLLAIITLGLAFFIYIYKVYTYVLNNTELVEY